MGAGGRGWEVRGGGGGGFLGTPFCRLWWVGGPPTIAATACAQQGSRVRWGAASPEQQTLSSMPPACLPACAAVVVCGGWLCWHCGGSRCAVHPPRVSRCRRRGAAAAAWNTGRCLAWLALPRAHPARPWPGRCQLPCCALPCLALKPHAPLQPSPRADPTHTHTHSYTHAHTPHRLAILCVQLLRQPEPHRGRRLPPLGPHLLLLRPLLDALRLGVCAAWSVLRAPAAPGVPGTLRDAGKWCGVWVGWGWGGGAACC